jgi:hypothetical protein
MSRSPKTYQVAGLSFVFASDIVPRVAPRLPDDDAILEAVRAIWPSSHSNYQQMIARRYHCYDMPRADAVRAILRGYSSPTRQWQTRSLNAVQWSAN